MTAALTVPGVAVAPTAVAAPSSVDNATIALKALDYVGRWGGAACVEAGFSGRWGGAPLGDGYNEDGQCRAFVNCIVRMATGLNISGGGGDYHLKFREVGAIPVALTTATRGDVIQYGNGGHTAIVVANLGGGRYHVVDSNYHLDRRVIRHDWTPPSSSLIWRLGTVRSASALERSKHNGRMIRHPDGTVDWVSWFGDRYWVPNSTVVRCLGDWGSVLNVSSTEFHSLPRNREGDPAGRWATCATRYVGRMLRQPDGTVDYVAATGFRYWVPNAATVGCLGSSKAVLSVSSTTFQSIPRNPWGVQAGCTARDIGRMLRHPDGTVDFVSAAGRRYWVPNSSTVGCLGGWGGVRTVTAGEFALLSRTSQNWWADCNATLRSRMIRKSDGTVDFVAASGQRYWVPNGTVVGCLGGWDSVIYLNTSRFDAIPRNATNTWATCGTRWAL